MKGKGPSLAIVFGGKPMGGKKPMGKADEYDDEETSDESEMGDMDMPPEFEKQMAKAMPEMEEDPERLTAFWKAIRACMEG